MPLDPSKPYDLHFSVDPNWVDLRLDQYVKAMIPSMSRTKIQKYIKAGRVEVNDTPRPSNWRVRLLDRVLLRCNVPEDGQDAGRDIPVDVIYEDDDILVVNKQTGLVVHPVGKHRHNTLLNALYWRYKDILPPEQEVSLANRLDQHTSGVILVTKHTEAKRRVQEHFEARIPRKAYLALCEGILAPDEGTVDKPIGPAHGRTDHCKMGIREDEQGKPCLTRFKVLERFSLPDQPGYTLVRLEPHTGRQHQLRVHMAWLGHSMVCDERYGRHEALIIQADNGETCRLARYALHACELTFHHPMTEESVTFSAPLPPDMAGALEGLRAGRKVTREPITGG